MKLFTPGPVQVSEEVLAATSKHLISHRSNNFRQLYKQVTSILEEISNSQVALLFAGSGTTAVDSIIWSLIEPGSKTLVPVWGEFGERLASALEARGAIVYKPSYDPRRGLKPQELMRLIETYKPEYIALVHNETSTGLAYRDLRQITEKAISIGAKVILDAVSSFPVEELDIEKWGIYAVATCSHKALAAPPGISIALLSSEAVNNLEKLSHRATNLPPSINLRKNLEFYKKNETPYTPPVNTLYGLIESLEEIISRGLEEYRDHHKRKSRTLYKTLPSIGLKPYVLEEKYQSYTVTSFMTPSKIGAINLKTCLHTKGMEISLGMGELKDKIVRIGVMGNINQQDVIELIEKIKVCVI